MEVHASLEISHALVVDEDALKRLWSHAEAFAGPPSANVSCIDGIERKFASLQDLIGYENPQRSEAQAIEIDARSRESLRSVSISIGGRWGAHARVSLRGEEQDVSVSRTRILDSLSGLRPWYSPLATLDLWMFWSVVLGGLWLVASTMAPTSVAEHEGRSFGEALRHLASGMGVIGPFFLFIWLVSRLRASYFPTVSMAFGQGLRRYQLKEQVRWAVIVSLVVGITGSAIYGSIGSS